MIDITGIDAKVGDVVTIFGEEPSTIELAKILLRKLVVMEMTS